MQPEGSERGASYNRIYLPGVCYKRKFISKRAYVSGGWYISEENYTMKNHVNVPTSTKCTNRWVRFVFCNRPQFEHDLLSKATL